MSAAWPRPGLSPLDRDREIARAYRAVLERIAPQACAVLDERVRAAGVSWPFGQQEPDDGVWLTRAEVAALGGVQPGTVSQWVKRNLLRSHPQGYWSTEVKAFLATPPEDRKPLPELQRRSIRNQDQLH